MENLNKSLYTNELINDWVNREEIIEAETYFITKYLSNKDGHVIEAGTGGGRLSFFIERLGFKSIDAFDYVPEMINCADEKKAKINSAVHFEVADATGLSKYTDNTYDYLIYLQQVLCFIEDELLFDKSIKEAYRIARTGGIGIFSFLDYDTRKVNSIMRIALIIIRKIRGERISSCYLPWLKINNKFNFKLFSKNQAQTYWIRKNEIIEKLEQTGFKILEVKNANQINNPLSTKRKGMLYLVCMK